MSCGKSGTANGSSVRRAVRRGGWALRSVSSDKGPRRTTKGGQGRFEYYAEDRRALAGARKLAGLDSVAQKSWKKGVRPENEPAFPKVVKTLTGGASVREGRF